LRLLAESKKGAGPEDRRQIAEQTARVQQLLELAKLGRSLLEALLATSRLDAGPLTRFVLRGR
jgi:hypothetical protein